MTSLVIQFSTRPVAVHQPVVFQRVCPILSTHGAYILIIPTADGTFPIILLEVILTQLRRMAILVIRITTFSAFDDKAR